MKLTQMTDEELKAIAVQKVSRGPRAGCYTSEANRAMGILRARHNSFIDCGFGNTPRDHSCFNGPVIFVPENYRFVNAKEK